MKLITYPKYGKFEIHEVNENQVPKEFCYNCGYSQGYGTMNEYRDMFNPEKNNNIQNLWDEMEQDF